MENETYTLPSEVKGYRLLNEEKVRRVLEGNPTRDGNHRGGILKADGTFDEDELLAGYDKLAGAIQNANGDKVATGSFYNFRARKAETDVKLEFRINGQLVIVPEKDETPAIVKAARVIEKAAKEVASKKKK